MSDLNYDESPDTIQMMIDHARVHDRHECFGLPRCTSCRCAALLTIGLDIESTEKWINEQPEGTIVRLP